MDAVATPEARPLPGEGVARIPAPKPQRVDLGRIGLGMLGAVTIVFLLAPIGAVLASSFTSGEYIAFPPKLPPSVRWYREFLEDPIYREALTHSIVVAILTSVLATATGTLAAFGFLRVRFRGQSLLYYGLFLPFLVPGLVLGIGLSVSLQPLGLEPLRRTFAPVVMAHLLWAMPLVFVVMVAVIADLDSNLEAAAMTLGAKPRTVMRTISLPLLAPGLLASFVLSFVISLHEFVMALFLTTTSTTTLPVVVWNSLRFEVRPIIAAIDSIMVASVVVVLFMLGKLVGLEKVTPR